jgi:hypothetical protein
MNTQDFITKYQSVAYYLMGVIGVVIACFFFHIGGLCCEYIN